MRGNSNSSNSVASTTISKIICALGKLWFFFQISSTMKPEMLVTIREYNPADPDPISKAWDATQNKVRIFWPFRDNMQEIPSAFYSSVLGKDMSAKTICQIRFIKIWALYPDMLLPLKKNHCVWKIQKMSHKKHFVQRKFGKISVQKDRQTQVQIDKLHNICR